MLVLANFHSYDILKMILCCFSSIFVQEIAILQIARLHCINSESNYWNEHRRDFCLYCLIFIDQDPSFPPIFQDRQSVCSVLCVCTHSFVLQCGGSDVYPSHFLPHSQTTAGDKRSPTLFT